MNLSGQPGCTSLPYVTVGEGQGDEVKERHKYRRLVLTALGAMLKTPIKTFEVTLSKAEKEEKEIQTQRKVSVAA